jgi:hypothetical protein
MLTMAAGLPTWAQGMAAWALACGWLTLCLGGTDWALRYLLEKLEDA